MQLKTLNIDKPETIDMPVFNVQGSSITTGFPACFTTTASSNDGIQAVLPAAANLKTFAGIAVRDIPNNTKGLVRAFGFLSSIAVFATGTSVTTAAGEVMGLGASSLGVNSTGLTWAYGPVVTMEAVGTQNSGGGYFRGFVRNL